MECPVCRSSDCVRHRPGAEPMMLRCRTCTLLWQPRHETHLDTAGRYEEAYYDAWGDLGLARMAKLGTFARYLQLLERYATKGRILDVGCAMGSLLEVARARGWEARGVEVSEYSGGQARGLLGEDAIHIGALDDVPFALTQFQAVTMTDVLEHLPDPLTALRCCHELLAPGGCILVATPQVGSFSERLMGRFWFQLKDEHLQLFTRKALVVALDLAGFEVLFAGPARKTLTISYLAHHFSVYPRPVVTPVLWLLNRGLGPLSQLRVTMPTGEQLVVARRAVGRDEQARHRGD